MAFADFVETQMAKVESDAVLAKALGDAAPRDLPFLKAGPTPVAALREHISVERLRSSPLFAVRVHAGSPEGLADIANAVAEACVGEARQDERLALADRKERLMELHRRVKGDVAARLGALDSLRRASASRPGATPGGSDPSADTRQALLETRTRTAALRATLDARRAALAAREAAGFTAQIEAELGGDAEVRRLEALRDTVSQKLLEAGTEADSLPAVDVQRLVDEEPRVRALKEELARKQKLLAKLLGDASDGEAQASEHGRFVPTALIAAALPDHPGVQQLASLHGELTQALERELDEEARLNETRRQVSSRTQQIDSLRSHALTIESKLQQYSALAIQSNRAAVRSLPERIAQEQQKARERIVAQLQERAEARATKLRDQLGTVETSIRKRRDALRPAILARLEEATLGPLRHEVKALETELAACKASEEVLRELLKKQEAQRATAEESRLQVDALREDLRMAQQNLRQLEQELFRLDTLVITPGVVSVASHATKPTRPEPQTAVRAGYGAAGAVLALLLAMGVALSGKPVVSENSSRAREATPLRAGQDHRASR